MFKDCLSRRPLWLDTLDRDPLAPEALGDLLETAGGLAPLFFDDRCGVHEGAFNSDLGSDRLLHWCRRAKEYDCRVELLGQRLYVRQDLLREIRSI